MRAFTLFQRGNHRTGTRPRGALRQIGASCLAVAAAMTFACACKKPVESRQAPANPTTATSAPPANPLKAPQDFANIADRDSRARALFLEASRVMLHPRCKNCHPAGNAPMQGDEGRVHDPPALRGADDHGPPGMECTSCHQDRNQELARVPGAPKWALAPIEMAWFGRTPGAICMQLKDPARNGHKELAQIAEHAAHDELVAWGWAPGHDRLPAPGTQAQFGALIAAWIENGAACPVEAAP